MRIALGAFNHEANTFSPHITDWADFKAKQLAYGEEMLSGWTLVRSEMAGAMSVLTAEDECWVLPTLAASALSGGPMRRGVFDAILADLLGRIRQAMPLDGVLLVLHGSMMAEDLPDATGEVLAQVRALVGPDLPVVGTLDLHANVTPRMVSQATALIGYQTAPHVDMYETGQRAARLLAATIRGEVRPTMAQVRLPMILPTEHATHEWGALAKVIDLALRLEHEPVLHCGVYSVQPWMDIPDIASSILVVANDDPQRAWAAADALAHQFWSQREGFMPEIVPPAEALRRAQDREGGTVVLCDSADGTTSGATGDSTTILEELLKGVPLRQTALLNVVDPDAVAQAIAVGVGNSVTVRVGGKLAPAYFSPVTFEGYVKTISDGVFRFKGPAMSGAVQSMGRTVVLVRDGIHLVVMERAVSQWDPELYRSLGEEPADARMVQVKSPMAFRAGYRHIADEVIIVEAPGAATPGFHLLPWRHLPRPIYPLDPDTPWP